MRTHVQLARPHRLPRGGRQPPRFTATPRPTARSALPAASRNIPIVARPDVRRDVSFTPRPDLGALGGAIGIQPNPYVDYGRFLTPEGGVLICYKGIDDRLRHTLWRLSAWSLATGLDAWFLLRHFPLYRPWYVTACLVAIAIVNWLIVRKPVEIYRNIEIRPDCMIIDGTDIFWLQQMEGGWPTLQPDNKGNHVLGGTYGTRFVEYLTVPSFDKLDRAPQVFAAHLQEAMTQLWTRPTM